MAGSGKTTFVQRLASHISATGKTGYLLNLDPAVAKVPYNSNVDIRDTVRDGSREQGHRFRAIPELCCMPL